MAKNKISLIVQGELLKRNYPSSKVTCVRNQLVWRCTLCPTVNSREYNVKLIYELDKHPNIYIEEPKPLPLADGKTSLPHVYDTKKQKICIYHRPSREWDSDKLIYKTIVPWICEWLFHYEIWAATGQWNGGGIHGNTSTKSDI